MLGSIEELRGKDSDRLELFDWADRFAWPSLQGVTEGHRACACGNGYRKEDIPHVN